MDGAGRSVRGLRVVAAIAAAWLLVSVVCVALPFEHGLRATYYSNAAFEAPAHWTGIDSAPASAQIFSRWRAAPPQAFSVQWSGFLHVPETGEYVFQTESDDVSRLFIDGELILDNTAPPDSERERDQDNQPLSSVKSASVPLTAGAHRVVLHFMQQSGRFSLTWSWSAGRGGMSPVPRWRLSPGSRGVAAQLVPWLHTSWWLLTIALLVASGWAARSRVRAALTTRRGVMRLAAGAALLALAALYIAAASEHAEVVNRSKARADQSGYLFDAREVYTNWHGRSPEMLIGFRMRMPLYAGFLALFFDPGMREWEFFDLAKTLNIWLSLGLVTLLGIVFVWQLGPLPGTTLGLVVAFSYFVFRAGYSQPELLFYFFFFLTFLASWHLFRDLRPRATILTGAAAGVFAGFAYLTKALTPPFVALLVGTLVCREVALLTRARAVSPTDRARALRRSLRTVGAAAIAGISFLAVVSPYILNSKRVFGQYFFNQNTTYYMWYDDGALARSEMLPHTDLEGRVNLPRAKLPSMRKYLRTHSPAQIAGRIVYGISDMALESYNR